MLFPGAIYIIGFILAIIAVAFSVACGFMIGLAIRGLVMKIAKSTKIWQKRDMGYVIKMPWWTDYDVFFTYSWLLGSIIVVYAVFGLWWYVINLMR